MWTDERWRLLAVEPGGLPVVVLLEPREHYAGPADLPDDLVAVVVLLEPRDHHARPGRPPRRSRARMGVMLGRVERAVLAVGEIGRVHIGRWGEGAEHLHWWFIGRPAGFAQLRSSFAEIWDEVLPPTPPEIWKDNLARVARAMG